MLCTSCRRQLSRGAEYCGNCGTPVAGAAEPLELVLGGRDARAARRRDDDRPRAGLERRAARPERVARARAHLARGQRRRGQHRGRGLERGHARRRRRDLAGDRAARRRAASSSARRRCASSAAATWPRRAARSWSSRARAWSCRRSARRAWPRRRRVRDEAAGALGLRAQAPRRQRGRQALGAQGPQPQHVPAALRQRRASVRAARRHALAGRPDRDRRAALRRPRARRGSRGCSPTSASAGTWPASRAPNRRGRGGAAGLPASGCSSRARRRFERVGGWFEALYRRGGWVLFTRPALYAIAALIVGGLGAFVYLIVGRYGTPFVVSHRVGLGALIFLLGRFAVVAVHETAHGLAMASFGRRIHRAGLQARGDLPLRVRGHLGGVVRAAQPPHRDQRGGPGLRLRARRDLLDPVRVRGGHDARRLLPAGVRGLRRRVLQPQPVHRPRRLPHPRRLPARAGPAQARERPVQPPSDAARPAAPTRPCSPATRSQASVGRYWQQALPSSCHCVMRRSCPNSLLPMWCGPCSARCGSRSSSRSSSCSGSRWWSASGGSRGRH